MKNFSEKMGIPFAETQVEMPEERQPIGLRLVGEVDPSVLSREAFNQRTDLLFHGAAKDFLFDDTFDYADMKSEDRRSDGSMTLGAGFYTTPSKIEAGTYSQVRSGVLSPETRVIAFLPYQAKMLDLRAKRDNQKNGDLSFDIMVAWTALIEDQFGRIQRNLQMEKEFKPNAHYRMFSDYTRLLRGLIKSQRTYALRSVLWTAPDPDISPRHFPSPPWSNLWAHFMRKQEVDGIIYNEGSEGGGENAATYVFYNLKAVGSYEAWLARCEQE